MYVWYYTNTWFPSLEREESLDNDLNFQYFFPANVYTFRTMKPFSVFLNPQTDEYKWIIHDNETQNFHDFDQKNLEVFNSTELSFHDENNFHRNLIAGCPVSDFSFYINKFKNKGSKSQQFSCNEFRKKISEHLKKRKTTKLAVKCMFHQDRKPSAVIRLSKFNNAIFTCYAADCRKHIFENNGNWHEVWKALQLK